MRWERTKIIYLPHAQAPTQSSDAKVDPSKRALILQQERAVMSHTNDRHKQSPASLSLAVDSHDSSPFALVI